MSVRTTSHEINNVSHLPTRSHRFLISLAYVHKLYAGWFRNVVLGLEFRVVDSLRDEIAEEHGHTVLDVEKMSGRLQVDEVEDRLHPRCSLLAIWGYYGQDAESKCQAICKDAEIGVHCFGSPNTQTFLRVLSLQNRC